MAYHVQKITYRGAARWTLYKRAETGKENVLGHYSKRKEALLAARLLAGWREKITIDAARHE
jgi:hypothetical protein